jgi:hypothetical protein
MPTPAAKKRRETPYSLGSLTVRLTRSLHAFITSQGRFDESIDAILRRLLKLPKWKAPDGKEGGKNREVSA